MHFSLRPSHNSLIGKSRYVKTKNLFSIMNLVWKYLHRIQPKQLFEHVLCYFLIFSYGWSHNVKLLLQNNGKNILQKTNQAWKKNGWEQKECILYLHIMKKWKNGAHSFWESFMNLLVNGSAYTHHHRFKSPNQN